MLLIISAYWKVYVKVVASVDVCWMASRTPVAAEPVYTEPTWAANGADENVTVPVLGSAVNACDPSRRSGVFACGQNGCLSVKVVHVIPTLAI